MKAAVLYETRQPLVVEEVELDDPKSQEVMVKIGAKGQINLQKTLSEIRFFDALDNESLPLRRNYQIIKVSKVTVV